MQIDEDAWDQARKAFATESEEDERALRRAIEALPELPTRDEVAKALCEVTFGAGQEPLKGGGFYNAADYVLSLLARRPATVESLTAQLAARPEPVVIDEALGERLYEAYESEDSGSCTVDMCLALRAVFCDRASVSVLQGDLEHTPAYLKELLQRCEDELATVKKKSDQLRAALLDLRDAVSPESESEGHSVRIATETRRERDKLRAELAEYTRLEQLYCRDADRTGEDLSIGMALRRLADDAVQAERLRAELEKTRSARDYHCDDAAKARGTLVLAEEARDAAQRELEKTRAELEAQLAHQRECAAAWDRDYNALRDRVDAARHEAAEWRKQAPHASHGWFADRIEAALLKPAPAEAEPVQHPPPESATATQLEAAGYWQDEFGDWVPKHPPNEALQQAVRMAEREVYVSEQYRTENAVQHPPPGSADSRPLAGAGEWLFGARFAPPESAITYADALEAVRNWTPRPETVYPWSAVDLLRFLRTIGLVK